MPFRFFNVACAAGATALALVGCRSVLPSLVPTPLPSAAPPPVAAEAHSGFGSVFHYQGTLSTTTASGQTVTAVSQLVTVTATPYPYATIANAVDYHSVETDRTGSSESVATSDTWRGNGAPSNGVVREFLYGSRSHDASGNEFVFRYPAPQTVDEIPETNGAAWSNSAALLYRESDADGTVASATYAASGAYDETVRYGNPSCYSAACVLNATVSQAGAARLSGSALVASGIDSIVLSAPRKGTIEVTYTYPGGYRQTAAVPAWFASGVPLYAESDAVRTGVAFPSACRVPASFGKTGNAVVRDISQIDPAGGASQTQQTQTYTLARWGTVCAQLSETTLQYYDYANARFSGVPLAVKRLSETLTLKSATPRGGRALDARARALAARAPLATLRWIRPARGPEGMRQNPRGG